MNPAQKRLMRKVNAIWLGRPAPMCVGRIFTRGGGGGMISPGRAKCDEISFFLLETKKKTFCAKNVIEKCQISKSRRFKAPSHPHPTPMSGPYPSCLFNMSPFSLPPLLSVYRSPHHAPLSKGFFCQRNAVTVGQVCEALFHRFHASILTTIPVPCVLFAFRSAHDSLVVYRYVFGNTSATPALKRSA